MDDFRMIIVEELKALNRKAENLETRMFKRLNKMEAERMAELAPIKRHVQEVQTVTRIVRFCTTYLIAPVCVILVATVLVTKWLQ